MSIKDSIYGTADDFFKGMRLGLSLTREERSRAVGKTSIKYKGKPYRRWKAGYSPRDKEYQRDTGDPKAFACECGANWGQYHELGCDLEDCPICKGQLLNCGHGPLFEAKGARCR